MSAIYGIVGFIVLIIAFKSFSKRNPTEYDVYKRILQYAINKNGIITSKDLKKIYSNTKLVQTILNELYKENVISLDIVSGGITNYTFHSFPKSYEPIGINNTKELKNIVFDIASRDEDGQVFLSDIVFAVDMYASNIVKEMENICDNDVCTMFLSPNNIKYYIIKE